MKKLLFIAAISFLIFNSCSRVDTCATLRSNRYEIINNHKNLNPNDQFKMLQQTDSMIIIFCSE